MLPITRACPSCQIFQERAGGKGKNKKSPRLWMAHNSPTLPNLYIQSSAPTSPLLPATQKVPTPTNQVPTKKKEFNFWIKGHPPKEKPKKKKKKTKKKKKKNPNGDGPLGSIQKRRCRRYSDNGSVENRSAAPRDRGRSLASSNLFSSVSPLQQNRRSRRYEEEENCKKRLKFIVLKKRFGNFFVFWWVILCCWCCEILGTEKEHGKRRRRRRTTRDGGDCCECADFGSERIRKWLCRG